MNPRIASLALLASLAACSDASSTTPTEDASTDVSVGDVSVSDTPTSDAPTSDAPTSDVPSADVAGDGGACAARDAGTLQRNYYCDFGAIHVLQHDGAAAEVQVEARVGTGGGCGVVDSVEIVRGATSAEWAARVDDFALRQWYLGVLVPVAARHLGAATQTRATGDARPFTANGDDDAMLRAWFEGDIPEDLDAWMRARGIASREALIAALRRRASR